MSSLSTSSLSFDTQALGAGTTATKTVTLTNSGTAALTVSTIKASGTNVADFIESDTCTGGTVAVGSTCKISVVFTATVAGSETAILSIVTNASNSPQTVSLSGTGMTVTAPTIPSDGSATSTIAAGSTATYSLQITGTGSATASLTLSLSCAGAPTGATCTVPSTVTVTPGTPATIAVSVTTTKASATSSVQKSPLHSFHDRFADGIGLALIPFGVVGLGLSRKRRKLTGLFLLALLAVAISSVGCSSSASKSSITSTVTPAGTYTLVVKATSGSFSQSTNLTLIVQ